jgi:hypothetical protein
MNSKVQMFKSISLTFRGFDISPQEVQLIVGVTASSFGSRSEPVKQGVKSLLKRSFANFSVEFPNGCRLDEMFPALMSHLGGVHHLCDVRDRVRPEFFELDIVLPVKGSEEQEGGFLPPAIIADLFLLKVNLTFQFL